MSRIRAWRRGGDEGSVSLEAAILAPVLIIALLVAVAAGRIHIAEGAVDAAARNAARAASLVRDPGTAGSEGQRIAQQTLQDQNLTCTSLQVDIPTVGFSAPLGTPASVTVTVTCRLNLADLTIPGFPGSKTITAQFTSPIDPYRGRQQ